MKILIVLFVFLLLSGLSQSSYATNNSCAFIFSGLKLNTKYRILKNKTAQLKNVRLLGHEDTADGMVLTFREAGKIKKFKLPLEELSSFKKFKYNFSFTKKVFKDVILGFLTAPVMSPVSFNQLVKVYYKPHRPLVNRSRVRIDGSLWSSKKMAETIADNIESFDIQMLAMGFQIPYFTKVRIGDRPLLPGIGPYALPTPTVSLSRKSIASVIHLMPQVYNTKIPFNPHVVLHERTHTILLSTFSRSAFILNRMHIHEALADFMAAHAKDDPSLGVKGRGDFVRNIEDKTYSGGKINDLHDLTSTFHNNSLLFSNLLWNLRKTIGAGKMNQHIMPLLAHLNSHGTPNYFKNSSAKENVLRDFEFMLALVLKYSYGKEFEAKVQQLVIETAQHYSLDIQSLIANSKEFKDYGNPMFATNKHTLSIMAGYIASANVLAMEALLLFAMLRPGE